jgi:phage replication O-like protein O
VLWAGIVFAMTEQEPYTRVPNALLDTMAELGNAELRVLLAIVRRTTGYQKACDVISLSQIHDMTGLMRRHVVDALDSLLARNYIAREPAKRNGFCYRLVPLGNQFPKGTSTPREPIPVPLGTQSLVPLGNPQKKEKENFKESIAPASTDAAPRPKKPRKKPETEDTTPPVIREALASECGADSRRMIVRVNVAAKEIWARQQSRGFTAEQTAAAVPMVAAFCRRRVHPFNADPPQPITPEAINDRWLQASEDAAARRRTNTNGYHPPPPLPPPMDPERLRQLREELNRERS